MDTRGPGRRDENLWYMSKSQINIVSFYCRIINLNCINKYGNTVDPKNIYNPYDKKMNSTFGTEIY
jgi:hypothetical protein